MPRLVPILLVLAMGGTAACAPGANVVTPSIPAQGPQYDPDDPCKGVVPQLCPR